MAFLASLDISASALTAQRLRMDVISENIANAATTRGVDGQPYQRKVVTFSERQSASFSSYLDKSTGDGALSAGAGVVVSSIENDTTPFIMEYDPNHPDADENGYVSLPNVDEAKELIDMLSTTRAYEANITVLNAIKGMAMKALEIRV